MLGRFGAVPPSYSHSLADQIPLVSGIESTMAWLDALAIRHEWTTDYAADPLIGAGGFNWYRNTGGYEETELFTPKTTSPFNLEGYPHNSSGFWEHFKNVEEFVGKRIGSDWSDKRWTNGFNNNNTWIETNALGETSPLFESGLAHGKWLSEGFNSPVYDGWANDPDPTVVSFTFTKQNQFGIPIAWDITNEGPILIGDEEFGNSDPSLGPVISSGWIQGYRYPSSGQPLNGSEVDISGAFARIRDEQGSLNGQELYKYWGLQTSNAEIKTAKQSKLFSSDGLTISGWRFPTATPNLGAPILILGTEVYEATAGSFSPTVISESSPLHTPKMFKVSVELKEKLTWIIFDLDYVSDQFGDIQNFPAEGIEYYNFRQLFGLNSSEYPIELFQNWDVMSSPVFNYGDQDAWSQNYVRQFIDHESTHCFSKVFLDDNRTLASGIGPVYYYLAENAISDFDILNSGHFYGEHATFSCFSVPETSGAKQGAPQNRIEVSGADWAPIVAENMNPGNRKRKLAILLSSDYEFDFPQGVPSKGYMKDAPFVDTTLTAVYYWSGIRPADGDPSHYSIGGAGLSATPQGYLPYPAWGGLPVFSNGTLVYPDYLAPHPELPAPGGTNDNFMQKNALREPFEPSRGFTYDFLPRQTKTSFFVPELSGLFITTNRSCRPRWGWGSTDPSGYVRTGSEYDWFITGQNGTGFAIGTNRAEPIQPQSNVFNNQNSGNLGFGFYS